MPFAFVHLSDIHFGQDRGGSEIHVYDDVKERLIEDATAEIGKLGGRAAGLLVTGDIAYAGKRHQYDAAAKWLDELAVAIQCETTDVQVVPGNHDIDWDQISSGCQMMVEAIIAEGEPRLSGFLKAPADREVLYNRFSAYRPFAEGYNCPLATQGGYFARKTLEIAPGRLLRFVGLNSALVCLKKDEEGKLLLGTQQHVLPRANGEELIVLAHHPMHWLQDAEEAKRYLKSRARIFISGHEHNPGLKVEKVPDGSDLMSLAAGATVPPIDETAYTYAYNILIFDWDEATDGLRVEIRPRVWDRDLTAFVSDNARLGGSGPTVVLDCPNFRRAPKPASASTGDARVVADTETNPDVASDAPQGPQMTADTELLLLHFFRDLVAAERAAVLVKMQALPADWDEPLTHGVERAVFDTLIAEGRDQELEKAIADLEAAKGAGGKTDHG